MRVRQFLSNVFSPPGATPGALPAEPAETISAERLDALDLKLAAVQEQLDTTRSALDVVSKMAMRTERKVYRSKDADEDDGPPAADSAAPVYPSPYLQRG